MLLTVSTGRSIVRTPFAETVSKISVCITNVGIHLNTGTSGHLAVPYKQGLLHNS